WSPGTSRASTRFSSGSSRTLATARANRCSITAASTAAWPKPLQEQNRDDSAVPSPGRRRDQAGRAGSDGFAPVDPRAPVQGVREGAGALHRRAPLRAEQLRDGRVVADAPGARELASKFGLWMLEDCAQAHGAAWQGRKVGAFGRAAVFSFYPSKNLTVMGDGGAIVTDDEEIAARCRRLRDHGRLNKDVHSE